MNRFSRSLYAVITAAALGLLAGGVQAQDLTLNINDAGFDPIPAGGQISYSVRVQNGGNSRSSVDNIAFTVPEGSTYTGIVGDFIDCTAPEVVGPGFVSCDIPELAPRATANATVQIQPRQMGVIEFTGTVSGGGVTVTERTTVTLGADLRLDLDAPTTVRAGEFLSFSAILTNNGPYDSTGAQFSMPLPSAFSSDITMPDGCAIAGHQVSCQIDEVLPVGSTHALNFQTQILTDIDPMVVVSASLESARPSDPDPSNDAADLALGITPGTDVFLGQSRTPAGLVYLDQMVQFTLTPDFAGAVPLDAQIHDMLPANYDLISVTPSGAGWTCVQDNPVICQYDAAAPDAAAFRAPIVITAMPVTESPAGMPITNTAEISSTIDVVPGNNTASDQPADIVAPSTDLVAQKSGPAHGLVTVGNQYDWRIWASNAGNIGFSGRLDLVEVVPPGLEVTALAAPSGWSCDAALPLIGPADILCSTDVYTSAAPLAVGAMTPEIIVTTTILEEGEITNGVRVSYSDADYEDLNPANNATTSSVLSGEGVTVPIADISLVKTVTSTGPYMSGDPVTFQVEVRNSGPEVAADVRLSDRLSDLYFANSSSTAIALDSIPPDASCSVTRGTGFHSTLNCAIPQLPAGESRIFAFTALAGGNAALRTNTAETWSAQTPDPDYANNQASADYEIQARTDVVVEKTASHGDGAAVPAGQSLVYRISARVPANGLSAAENVTVTDQFPAGLRIVSVTPSHGSCGPVTGVADGLTTSGSSLTCNLGTVANGNTRRVTIEAVPSTSIADSVITNHVAVTTTTPEMDADNNAASISHAISRPSLDLVINKTDRDDPLEVGTQTVYRVHVENTGPSEAFNLEVTDVLPIAGMQYDGFTAITPGLTCTEDGAVPGLIGGNLICRLSNLPVGQRAEFEVAMTAVQRGQWVNRAEVRSDEYGDETITANNDVIETTTVFDRSNLVVTKTPSQSTVDLMEAFTWTIRVDHLAAADIGLAENIVLRDSLPDNMVFSGPVTATGGNCDVSGRDLICVLPEMLSGDSYEVTLPVRVTEITQNPQLVFNSVTVTTDSFDINPDDGMATSAVEVLSTEVSGTIWRDFDGDDFRAPHDSGVPFIPVTLSSAGITRNVITDADGSYRFDLLPPGNYTVSYTLPPENADNYALGSALPGSVGGGFADDAARIDGIVATTETFAAGNDFTLIPQPSLALSKSLAPPVMQPDGAYLLDYTFRATNRSQEPIGNFSLIDSLQSDFGSYTSSPTPGYGEYTVLHVQDAILQSASDDAVSLTTPVILSPSDTGLVRVMLLVNPALPRTGTGLTFANSAEVEGFGMWSGERVVDRSNDGTVPQHGADSVTQRSLGFAPDLTLTMTAQLEQAGPVVAVGDIIRYSFTLHNIGNTPLVDVSVADLLPGLVWDRNTTIALLDPDASDSASFAAHYVLTQDDIERGRVENSATAVGRWAVDGVSDPVVSVDDSATIHTLAEPGLSIEKTEVSNTIQNPTQPGDRTRYSFTVENTGNVVLRDIVLTDLLDGVVPDPADGFQIGTLALPGEAGSIVTIYAEYSVTQDDIDAGEVTNHAEVAGHYGFDQTPISAEAPPITTPLHPAPEMRVTKLPDNVPAIPYPGDAISWAISIENTGNTRLEVGTIDEPLPGTSISAPAHAVLQPGETTTVTATHQLTQPEIDAGQISNQVIVSGRVPGSHLPFDDTVSGNDPAIENSDPTSVPLIAAPAIALMKQLTSDVSEPLFPGDMIEFLFTIRNTGNVTLTSLHLVDSMPGLVLADGALAMVALAPGDEAFATGSYQITAADIAAGGLTSTASITAISPDGSPVSDISGTGFDNDDPTPAELLRVPRVALIKTIHTAPTLPMMAGDVIEYAFAIHNTGNVELTDISLSDLADDVQIIGSRDIALPVGEVDLTSFIGQYALKQNDVDSGSFANTARVDATGTGSDGNPLTISDLSGTALDNDHPTTLNIIPAPALSILKAADDSAVQNPTQVDDQIIYSFTATNAGNVTLYDVTFSDPLVGGDLPDVIASLAPGEDQIVTATYAVAQSDIESGDVRNTASAWGDYFDLDSGGRLTTLPTVSNQATVTLHQAPSIDLVTTITSAPAAPARAGDQVLYGFTVTNTGNVELSGIMITGMVSGTTISGSPITLAPGVSDATSFTASYMLTQADIEAGYLDNQAEVEGTGAGIAVSDLSGNTTGTDQPTRLVIDQMPGMQLTKAGDISGFADVDMPVAGDVIRYGFMVENTGNVTLHDITIDDVGMVFDGPVAPFDLAPAQAHMLPNVGGHALTQAEVDAGVYENTAIARAGWGNDGSGKRFVISADDTVTTSLKPLPGIDLVKTIDHAASQISMPPQAGDVVAYSFTVTNTGNVTLTDIDLSDPLPGLELSGQIHSLAPGLSDASSFTASYRLTQADIERGEVSNQAQITGTWARDGSGTALTVSDLSGTTIGSDDKTVLTIAREAGLSIVKYAEDLPAGPVQQADVITYRFAVTNTGNLTLQDVTVIDPLPGLIFLGNGIASLEPGHEQILTATYAVSQADIDAGAIDNSASVSGYFTDPLGGPDILATAVSNNVEVRLLQQPRLAVIKTARSELTTPAALGQQIIYDFTVMNPGNTTITDVTLTDSLPGLSVSQFDLGDMTPGDEIRRSASYMITQEDIDAGQVVSHAFVLGMFGSTPISDLSGPDPVSDEETIVPVVRNGGLRLVKAADGTALSDPALPGQQIAYSFTVTNTGNVTLKGVAINDPLEGLVPDSFMIGDLAPGASAAVGPAIYDITQADINLGQVENRAFVSGEYGPVGGSIRVEAASLTGQGSDDTTVTPLAGRPAIALIKQLAPESDTEALRLGDEVRWHFTVANLGNVPLTGVTVTEEMATATVFGGPIDLDVGAVDSTSFTAVHEVSQADLDLGQITNSARVTGYFSAGSGAPLLVEDVSGATFHDNDPTVIRLSQRAGIGLVKTADISGFSVPPQAGDLIRYNFTIINTGEVTLRDVTLIDPLPGLDLTGAPIPSLPPGAKNDTAYSGIYRLTQSDLDDGAALENQASVTAAFIDAEGMRHEVSGLSGSGAGAQDPTIVMLQPLPGLELVKTADMSGVSATAQAGQNIIFNFSITNTGNVTLSNVTVDDPLPGLELSGAPIASLAPGETSTAITGRYAITIDDIRTAGLVNTARPQALWRTTKGAQTPVIGDEATVAVALGYPEIGLRIVIDDLRDLDGDGRMGLGDQVLFRFEVVNSGTVPLEEVSIDSASLSLPLPGLHCTSINLASGDSASLQCAGALYSITADDVRRGDIRLTGEAVGISGAGVVVRGASKAAILTDLGQGGITLEKLAEVETAMIGDLVPYRIRIGNSDRGVSVTTRLEDHLPAGFSYHAGSARLDGQGVEVLDAGRTLVLTPITLSPGQTRVLTYFARVGGSVRPGAYDNQARLVNPVSGREVAPPAKATVQIRADAVLQCATVLGRVFDDIDRNGQMAASSIGRGLPHVRLIAPNGLEVRTDEHGRFSVPCAALPKAIGSNFMLKLDERSLPAGYRTTTENPRVVRLTPGMITRMDFGAALARLVRIDLAANAFEDDHLGAALTAGLRKMVDEIRDKTSVLRITYLQTPDEPTKQARKRLRQVERAVRSMWRSRETYKLHIETSILSAGASE